MTQVSALRKVWLLVSVIWLTFTMKYCTSSNTFYPLKQMRPLEQSNKLNCTKDTLSLLNCPNECPIGYSKCNGRCGPIVCGSQQIRVPIHKLSNSLCSCEVIDGNFILQSFDGNVEEWNTPLNNLVEITGYLLIYNVSGLHSLGQLLPNLRVIRGQTLHQDYALIIYDASDLKEIDLYKLAAIMRGSVRIQKNYNLCYANTIDWSLIIKQPIAKNVFENESDKICASNCQTSCWKSETGEARCWSADHCQLYQDDSGCKYGYDEDGVCCPSDCIGGCYTENLHRKCHVCQNYRNISSGQCVDSCSESYYLYKEYLCISIHDCRKNDLMLYNPQDGNANQCLPECPSGFTKDKNTNKCKACQGQCTKSCHSKLVDTIEKARDLKGCTSISNSLIISISAGRNTARELEANLGMIEEVHGYIRVYNSHALFSLNFLSSLKTIGGQQLYDDKYALYVHGNDNLKEIWSSKKQHPKLTISNKAAKMMFFNNPRLCKENIIELGLNITNDLMRLTNGHKASCTSEKIPISVHSNYKEEKGVLEVQVTEIDSIAGFFVYYKLSPEKNSDYTSGRDTCNDDWEKKYMEHQSTRLENLLPDMWYAVYVEDTSTDPVRGQVSDIIYAKTKPYNPSEPRKLRAAQTGPRWMLVTWEPPRFPNGVVTDYIIFTRHLDADIDDDTNYCNIGQKSKLVEESNDHGNSSTIVSTEQHETNTIQLQKPSKCCSCSADALRNQRLEEKTFDENLFNLIYMGGVHRTKRNTYYSMPVTQRHSSSGKQLLPRLLHRPTSRASEWPLTPNLVHDDDQPRPVTETAQIPHYRTSSFACSARNGESVWRTNKTNYTLTDLHHSSHYEIKVYACHNFNASGCVVGEDFKKLLCSIYPARIFESTQKIVGYFKVNRIEVNNTSESTAVVSWKPPANSNGQIISYQLFFESITDETKTFNICITAKDFEESDHMIKINDNKISADDYLLKLNICTRNFECSSGASETIQLFLSSREISGSSPALVPVILVLLIFLPLTIFGVVGYHKYFKGDIYMKQEAFTDESISVNPNYPGKEDWMNKIPKEFIYDPTKLTLDDESPLGQGNFGLVLPAHLHLDDGPIPVAVKQIMDYQARNNIVQEAAVMLQLKTYHLVQAYGVVPGPTHMFLVMELMKGDLLNFLRQLKAPNHDVFGVLTLQTVCGMAIQIGDGMAYLASKKIVHRDLAARNCLVSTNPLTIKISDFGRTRMMSKNYYRTEETKNIPVRWLPPEYLMHQKFDSQSDVWSYGVVLWEILSGGATPYHELKGNREVLSQVTRGYTLESQLPPDTPSWLATIAVSCWRFHGHQRPYFPQIIAALFDSTCTEFQERFRKLSFYHAPEGQDYKRRLHSVQEDESDHPQPTASSVLPFTSSQGPPLPRRPMNGLRQPQTIRCASQAAPRQGQKLHQNKLNVMPELEARCCQEERNCDSLEKETNAKSSLLGEMNMCTTKNFAQSTGSIFHKNIKERSFYQLLTLRRSYNALGQDPKEKHSSTLPKPHLQNKVVMNIDKHGNVDSSLSSSRVLPHRPVSSFPDLTWASLKRPAPC